MLFGLAFILPLSIKNLKFQKLNTKSLSWKNKLKSTKRSWARKTPKLTSYKNLAEYFVRAAWSLPKRQLKPEKNGRTVVLANRSTVNLAPVCSWPILTAARSFFAALARSKLLAATTTFLVSWVNSVRICKSDFITISQQKENSI